MAIPRPWQGEAFNQVPSSENLIHGDEVARRYGFRGGLVPGVTVTAYLCHPAVVAWGLDFLARGRVRATVSTPLYDRKPFRVEIDGATDRAYDAALVDEDGARCATASVELPEEVPAPPVLRGDPCIDADFERPRATRRAMEELRERSLRAIRVRWNAGAEITGYLRDSSKLPALLRPDGGGYANPAFLLGLTNWALGRNVKMEAWLHLQTDSQFYRPVPEGCELTVESAIADLFEKKGHEFVDLDVGVHRSDTREPVMSARLRAIYRLRGG